MKQNAFPVFVTHIITPFRANYYIANQKSKSKEMRDMKKFRRAFCFILTLYTLLNQVCITPIFAEANCEEAVAIYAEEDVPVISDNVIIGSRFRDLLLGDDSTSSNIKLIPGGTVFGAKIKQKYVTVTDAKGVPALKCGDSIISVDGKRVNCVADVKKLVAESGGNSVTIRALHNGNEIGIEIRPSFVDGEYKLGISLRDGAAGIGTVTFIDPKTGCFGGLGHGICDSETGEVISMDNGVVTGVILGGVHKGESGKPGELTGLLTDEEAGTLSVNSECGLFGRIYDTEKLNHTDAIPIGTRSEIQKGEATIISTLKNGMTSEYKVEIFDIDTTSRGSKSFRIRVTDDALKTITGGIVRGMSGSPIIQNGKLVGAVTHVMVANPTEGYGIFIENMLNAAENQVQPKAA